MAEALFPFGDRFEDEGPLGRGGGGEVRRARDRLLGRSVALKVVRPIDGAAAHAAFLDEGRMLARLEHPHIVPVYDLLVSPAGDGAALVMKLVEGRPLSVVLAAQADDPLVGPALERILRTLLSVCDAVAFAHSRSVLHRDLNPSNVMLGAYGQVYVTDWGLAWLLDRTAPDGDAGEVGGTLAYMAPEQAAGRTDLLGPATDVFGIGAILYELLTGRPPWTGSTPLEVFRRASAGRIVPPAEVVPGRLLPAGLCRIAVRALSADPAERPADVGTLRAEIEEFLSGGGWFERVRFTPGEVVVREGERDERAYILMAGRCEVFREGRDGEQRVLRAIGPGEVFGEVALLTGAPRTASVRALTAAEALLVTPPLLDRELGRNAWFRAFARAAAERFAELDAARLGDG